MYIQSHTNGCYGNWGKKMCSEKTVELICYLYDNINGVVTGIIATIICGLVAWLIKKGLYWFKNRSVKKIFGFNCWNELYPLVVGKLHPKDGTRSYLFVKPGSTSEFTQAYVMPYSEVLASDYIKVFMVKELNAQVHLVFDEDLKEPGSFCSFGGYNNNLSLSVLRNSRNIFYDIPFSILKNGKYFPCILNKKTQKQFVTDADYDYGVIIKILENNQNVQICIIGLGEIGTQGSAYFLATRWKMIASLFKDEEFGCVVKVLRRQVTSVEMVDSLTTT